MSLRRSARTSTGVAAAEPSLSNGGEPEVAKPGVKRRGRAKKATDSKQETEELEDPKTAASSMPPPPSTPAKKRKRGESSATTTKPPPLTPTPSGVGLLTASYSTGDIDDTTPPPATTPSVRQVRPHMTNAALQTPGGSRVIPKPSEADVMEPDLGLTTANLLEKACEHLISVDPTGKLRTVIEQYPCRIFSPEGLAEKIDPFRSLVSGICGQQVSGAAAKSIKNKFVALFNEGNEGVHVWPTPQVVAETDITHLRMAGLSQRKAEYVKGLAEKFANGELSAKMLAEASDEEVMEKLIAVRGLGKWSVEMFACFALKRMDILSVGDLGVERGMAAYLGRDVAKLKAKGGKNKYMAPKEMLEVAEKFSPYRSLFMWYMWRIENVDVTAMQDA